MKKLLTTILLLIVCFGIQANPISRNLAKKVAINFMSAKKGELIDTFAVKNIYTQKSGDMETFYVFSFPKGGFVIISADNNADPVIGYSLTSPATSKITNPVIQKRFDWYSKQVEFAAKSNNFKSSTKDEWNSLISGNISKGHKAAGPLLQTIWNQSPFYNELCPTGTPTGCVATAMSQIMKYHNWPASGNGWHKYTHPTYGVQYANYQAESYNWTNMPSEITAYSAYNAKVAVSTLCYHAGVAVNMNYGTDGSGAFSQDVLYALTSYFKYDPSTINIYEFDVNNQTEWINKIKAEIDAARPVYYYGSSTADGGHAWVCDGYDNNNKLHINWGWGGSYDGYFNASAMNPGSYSFSEKNGMITGIKPGNTNQNMQWIRQSSGFDAASRGIRYISAVNNRIAWAIGLDGSGSNANIKEYTFTIDGGETWNSGIINIANTTNYATSMISAVSDSIAWVPLFGPNGGGLIAKTSDGGKSWVKQSTAAFTAPNGFPNVIHFWDKNNGFCMGDPNGGYFEIYTTTNGGDTWTRVPQANIPSNLSGEYGTIGYYDTYGDIVWFSTNKGRIFKSTNKGYNWVAYQTPVSIQVDLEFKDANNGLMQAVGESSTQYFKTTDGGQNWTEYTPVGNFYTADFIFIPGTDTLISTGSDYKTPKMGVSYSIDNGNTFTEYADFYKNYQFTALGASPNGTVWAGSFNSTKYYGGMWKKGNSVLSANFSVNKTSAYKNDSTVVYTDGTYGNPESWEWNFGANASPATKSGIGPHTIKYTDFGDKTVTLTVSNGNDIQVYIKEKIINITWTAGVDTDNLNNSHNIYPNPANAEIYVRIKDFEKGSISVYSVNGAVVWQSNGVTQDDRINISNLSSGLYIVKIQNHDGSIVSKKLTINR